MKCGEQSVRIARGDARPWHGLAALLLAAIVGSTQALAQAPNPPPTIDIASRVLLEADVSSPLPIRVGPGDRIPPRSYLQIRGLPGNAVLSEGNSISPGVWAVPLGALPQLAIRVPKSDTGSSSTVNVRLVSFEGAVIGEAKTTVVVAASYVLGGARSAVGGEPRLARPPAAVQAPPSQPAPSIATAQAAVPAPPPTVAALPPVNRPPARPPEVTAPPARSPPPVEPRAAPPIAMPAPPPAAEPAPQPPALTAEERARAMRYVQVGNRHFGNGNIAAARGFYQRAAEAGLAEGAVKLGATYDPVELAALGAQGLDANPAEARRWYEQARRLGAGGMEARLSRLGGR